MIRNNGFNHAMENRLGNVTDYGIRYDYNKIA